MGDICALVIIGVHKKSSNFAVLGELRRYPLYITIINTILKYLNRIKELDHDSLLYQSFLESKFIWQSGKESWFSNVNKILKELTTNIEDYDINSAKKNLITKFQKYWIKKIELNGKLDTYQKFKLEEKSI